MDPMQMTVLEILHDANGHVSAADLVREFKRRMGVDRSRTRGVIRTVEQSLLRLQGAKLVSASTQVMPSKRHTHCSTVGRDVKFKRPGCCSPSPEEKEASERVKEYRCAFFSLTEAGKKALHK